MVRVVVRDLLVVGLLLTTVALVTDTPALQGAIPLDYTKLVMTLLTIAGSATAAILAYVVSRLAGDRRAAWLAVPDGPRHCDHHRQDTPLPGL